MKLQELTALPPIRYFLQLNSINLIGNCQQNFHNSELRPENNTDAYISPTFAKTMTGQIESSNGMKMLK